jgi:ribonuclease HII
LRICGVDDAGRGPVIGPLVIAGVLVEEEKVSELKELGVRDSKTLPAVKREKLAIEISQLVIESHLVELSPKALDEVVHRAPKLKRLNYLEAVAMAAVIEKLRPEVAYVDASDVVPERFGRDILGHLSYRPKVISEHYADSTYPVVSAASILAKVERDRRVRELRDQYGEFGSGYSTDERTIRFLEDYYKKNRGFPPIVRKSWDTLQNIVDRIEQSRLADF